MKIKRLFTMEGEGPYQSLEFENRTSVIRNPDGSVVSEWENVTVPKHWSQVATDIMAQKYFRKAGIPKQLKPAKEKGIPSWLQPSLPDHVETDQEKNLHIVGVVRQDGYEESFQHLSMGTQEQIAVLVRLAFAEMLVEQGHPATVVLDDALVFSDDRRMDRMFDILNMVGQQVQIIVLTCREQLFEGVGGKHLSLKAVNSEDLVSA